MRVELTKYADGGSLLRCVRDDGSATWQRHRGPQASFFPTHDLTHYAVETTLGTRRGFFGLLAEGWDVDDTGGKGARGPLPAEATFVERVVGLLDVERATGGAWSAADFEEQLARAGARHMPNEIPLLTDGRLAAIRARRRELFAAWAAVAPGETLTLEFS